MKNTVKIDNAVEPLYGQFERLGELYEDSRLSFGFLKQARRTFGKQYFFELKLVFKAENRALKHEYKLLKGKDKKRFKEELRAFRAKRREELKKARNLAKTQSA